MVCSANSMRSPLVSQASFHQAHPFTSASGKGIMQLLQTLLIEAQSEVRRGEGSGIGGGDREFRHGNRTSRQGEAEVGAGALNSSVAPHAAAHDDPRELVRRNATTRWSVDIVRGTAADRKVLECGFEEAVHRRRGAE